MTDRPAEPTTETDDELEAPAWDVSKFDDATWPTKKEEN